MFGVGTLGQLGGNGGPLGAPILFNFKASQFTTWNAGLARVVAGTGRARILGVGDSTMRGVGSGDVTTYVNAKLYGFFTKTATQLAALGVASNTQDFLGSGAVAIANINTYYPGLAVGAGWVISSAQTMAGFCIANNVDATTVTYTPPVNVDNFEFYYPQAAAAGVIQYQINGGTAVQITETNASNGFVSVVIPVTLGSNTITFTRVSGNAYIAGIRAWDSTTKAVDLLNLGASGWKAADWATSTVAYNALPAMKYLAASADLVIVDLTINDWAAPTNIVTLTSQWQTIVTGIKAAGSASILLLTGNPSDASFATLANQAAVTAAYEAFAVANNLPLIDQTARDGSYLAMNAKGWMFDTAHPNKLGHADLGQFLGSTISSWGNLVITSYSNPLSTGNRPSIAVSTTATLGAGSVSALVDGAYTAGAPSPFFNSGQSSVNILFDFGVQKVINAFKWYQDIAISHGTWVMEGSNDNSSYTQIGSSFSLGTGTGGGSTQGAPTEFVVPNSSAYRYYRLRQTAGTTSSNPWLEEIEFKIN